jgi:hypothetical protein
MPGEIPHGTRSGYQQHRKANENPCEACREANRRYAAEYRGRRPAAAREAKRKTAALQRAHRRLGKMYPADLAWLYEEELER